MTPRQLTRLAEDLAGRSDKAIDEELRRQHLDAQDRLAVRIEIQAQAQQHINANGLATDRPPSKVERLLSRIGVELNRVGGYTEQDLDRLLQQAGMTDVQERLMIKTEAFARKLIRPAHLKTTGHLSSMRASADPSPRGKVLRNADGTPCTLCFS